MKQSRLPKSKQSSSNQVAHSSHNPTRQGGTQAAKVVQQSSVVSSISGGNSLQGKSSQGVSATSTKQQQPSRLQSSQNQRSKGQNNLRRQDSNHKKQQDAGGSGANPSTAANKLRQNMQNQKEFQLRKTKNPEQRENAAGASAEAEQHGKSTQNQKNASGHQTTQPSLEVINKTGNTVYINGLSSGSNIVKKSSVDMSGKEVPDYQQKGHLFKNVAQGSAESAMRQQAEDAPHYGIIHKGSNHVYNNVPGSAQVSRAQKLKSQQNQIQAMQNGQSMGSEQQFQQMQSRIEDPQLMLGYQNISQNGGLFPGANGSTMLSKTADKRQGYGQRQQNQLVLPPPQVQQTPSLNGTSSQLAQHLNQVKEGMGNGVPLPPQNVGSTANNRVRPKSSVPVQKQSQNTQNQQQQNALLQQQMQVMQQLQLSSNVNGQAINNSNMNNSSGAGARKANISSQIHGSQQQPYIITKQMNLMTETHNSQSKKAGLQAPPQQLNQQNASILLNTQPVKHGNPGNNINVVSQTPQIIMNKQNMMAASYAQMQALPHPAQASQPSANPAQTAFFEKRNRSRGVAQQSLITNPQASQATPTMPQANGAVVPAPHASQGVPQQVMGALVTQQQMSLQTCNTFNSPAVMPDSSSSKKNQPSIMQNLQMQTMGSDGLANAAEIMQYQNQRQLLKDFNAHQLMRQQAAQGTGDGAAVLQANLSVSQAQPLSGQRVLSGTASGAPNSSLPRMVSNTGQHIAAEMKPRSGETGGQEPGEGQFIPVQSFDKRPPQPQMVLASGGFQGQLQDLKNKENFTQKQASRKGNTAAASGVDSAEATNFSSSQKARILQLSNSGFEHSQTVAKNSQRSEMAIKNPTSNTHQNSLTHLRESGQTKLVEPHREPQTQKALSSKPTQMQQENIEMQLHPQTDRYFKRTYRHFFRRRPNKLDHPVIIVQFQGVLGDFFKDQGISAKQDHIMSRAFLQQQANLAASHGQAMSEMPTNHMWIRIGTIDGLRYLSKHFQIVIFNRDSDYEELGQPFSQIQMIQSYLHYSDIIVDGIYGQSRIQMQVENGSEVHTTQSATKNKKDKGKTTEQRNNQLKKPHKQAELWEDYKQIYLDFGLTNDKKIRDKVLFVNSFDSDYNARQEDIRFDSKGYFLLDIRSKPARPLVAGIPLSYEAKEKEIDLSDKGQMFQFKLAKNKVQTKEMPVTILVPNPRTVYCQQLSFASVAKTIMTMCFVGQNLNLQMSKKLSPQEIDYLQFYLKNLRYLQELDVKVQKDQCLLQYNPSQQRLSANLYSQYSTQQQASGAKGAGDQSIDADNHKTQMYRSTNSQNDRGTANTTNQNVKGNQTKFGDRNNSNQSIDSMYNRPRSSNSHGRILQAHGPPVQPLNQEEEQQMNIDIEFFQNETMVIPLTEQLFQNISWASSFDFINEAGAGREILGLIPVRSNIIWRYFISLLKQRSNIRQLREKRVAEIKTLLQKLDQLQTEQGKLKRQQQIQDIYDTLKQVQTSGNPLTNMMARNLKVFIKIYAEVKRKSKRELENFTEALVMDQKMAELEKQNLENRIFLLGAKKPNQFFNTHPRAYEKVPLNVTNQMNQSIQAQQQQQSKLQENQGNNMNLANGGGGSAQTHNVQKQKTNNLQNSNFACSSISSIDQVTDPSHRSLIEIAQNSNQKHKGNKSSSKHASNATAGTQAPASYGKKKQSTGLQSACNNQSMNAPQSAIQNFSTQSSAAHYSRRRMASRGNVEPHSATDGNQSKRSNQSSEFQLPPPTGAASNNPLTIGNAGNNNRGTNQSMINVKQ